MIDENLTLPSNLVAISAMSVACVLFFVSIFEIYLVPGTRPVGLVIIKGYFQTPAQLTMFGVFDTTESTAQ